MAPPKESTSIEEGHGALVLTSAWVVRTPGTWTKPLSRSDVKAPRHSAHLHCTPPRPSLSKVMDTRCIAGAPIRSWATVKTKTMSTWRKFCLLPTYWNRHNIPFPVPGPVTP
eukprot:2789864-Amphidinium_carterae.1